MKIPIILFIIILSFTYSLSFYITVALLKPHMELSILIAVLVSFILTLIVGIILLKKQE